MDNISNLDEAFKKIDEAISEEGRIDYSNFKNGIRNIMFGIVIFFVLFFMFATIYKIGCIKI